MKRTLTLALALALGGAAWAAAPASAGPANRVPVLTDVHQLDLGPTPGPYVIDHVDSDDLLFSGASGGVQDLSLSTGTITPLPTVDGKPFTRARLDGDTVVGTIDLSPTSQELVVATRAGTVLLRQPVTTAVGFYGLVSTALEVSGDRALIKDVTAGPALALVDLTTGEGVASPFEDLVDGDGIHVALGGDHEALTVTHADGTTVHASLPVHNAEQLSYTCHHGCPPSPSGTSAAAGELLVRGEAGELNALVDPTSGAVTELPVRSGPYAFDNYVGGVRVDGDRVVLRLGQDGLAATDVDSPSQQEAGLLPAGARFETYAADGLVTWVDGSSAFSGRVALSTPAPAPSSPSPAASPSPAQTSTASLTPAPAQRALVALHIGLRKRGASISGTVAGPPGRQRLVITDRHGRNRNVALLSPDASGHVLWIGTLRPGDHGPHLAPLTGS